ncbi:metal ABC transporter solute-binding protein, Zn/Mn family [Haloactinomyces albus]|uniref:Zinc transport system substrate-binding protein n=1 Tax=Haloactinomyces albus TaxID=1352928 RepID=A0AAE3ZGN1_9ACTN|nr:zinc ABC transporter substrate-binding protein [Haloactinomyces albus]MDR7303214.1 zinc transport system substrate-binding protein [Haloactinomyces albus]
MHEEWMQSMSARDRLNAGLVVLVSAVLTAACGSGGNVREARSEDGSRPVQAFVSILPQRYIVEQIGGTLVDTQVLLPPGASPATYAPKPSQWTKLADADAYFAVDVPFERAMSDRIRTAGGDDMRWVRTWKDVDRGKLDNGEPDPHIWLSPRRVAVQAATVADALSRIDPAHADTYRKNLARFQARVDDLDRHIERKLKPYSGSTFMSFHPAWKYFAEDYGLNMITIEAGGKEPSAGELRHLIGRARKLGIEVIFVQPQFSQADARTIAAQVGAGVEPINPLPADWERQLQHVATALATSFEGAQR